MVTDPSLKVFVITVRVETVISVVRKGKVIVVVVESGSGGQIRVHPGGPVTTGLFSVQTLGSMDPWQEEPEEEEAPSLSPFDCKSMAQSTVPPKSRPTLILSFFSHWLAGTIRMLQREWLLSCFSRLGDQWLNKYLSLAMCLLMYIHTERQVERPRNQVTSLYFQPLAVKLPPALCRSQVLPTSSSALL